MQKAPSIEASIAGARVWVVALVASFAFTKASLGTSLQWENGGGFRRAPLSPGAPKPPGFEWQNPESTGIQFTNHLSQQRLLANANLLNGSGVALGDFDSDGQCDVYLCTLEGTNRLFRNLGNWRFEDVTDKAGVGLAGQLSTGAVFADVDGDRLLDLLVTSMGGPNALLVNQGGGRFHDATESAGLASRWGASSLALADVDGNGTPDLYVANYGVQSILRSGGSLNITFRNGRWVVQGRYARRVKVLDGKLFELGEPDTLYLNDGSGRFNPVSWTEGRFLDQTGNPIPQAPWDQSLSVLLRDLTGDGAPDIYVCGDGSTLDRFWINDGTGRFRSASSDALPLLSFSSMGVDAADVDRDGHDDLFVVDMLGRGHAARVTQRSALVEMPPVPEEFDRRRQFVRNSFFRARGDGTFDELAYYTGTGASDWSWGCVFLDVDLDGWEDILVSTGFPYGVDDLDTRERIEGMGKLSVLESRRTLLMFPPLLAPNIAFKNNGGLKFEETGALWGFSSTNISQGMALADLDNNGTLDVVINCLNAPALVYRNQTSAPRVAVRLKGLPPNTQGIGARISVFGGAVPVQTQEVISGGRYASGDDPVRVFAAGTLSNTMRIEVRWRNGKQSIIDDVRSNYFYEVVEPGAEQTPPISVSEVKVAPDQPAFEDASDRLNHQHIESRFDDYARQPLLPRAFSSSGPGVAWFDLDGDGREELIVGSSRGECIAFYRADAGNRFVRIQNAVSNHSLPDDAAGIVGWAIDENRRHLAAANFNYEAHSPDAPSAWIWSMDQSEFKAPDPLPATGMAVGPLALADVRHSGTLDLFAGGRLIPGRYPKAASSYLFRKKDGEFVVDRENSEAIKDVGLVTGAVWSDLDGDGWPDLALACEWGPVRVFQNQGGTLAEKTESWGLAGHTGLWTSLATGDFDGNGLPDIVAGNWGENTSLQESAQGPWFLFYGDLRETGAMDILEAYALSPSRIVPRRDLNTITKALPGIRQVFRSHAAYAAAGIEEVLGQFQPRANRLRAVTLKSMIFLNRHGRFEPVPLPPEAQWAPAMGLTAGDLDGDGNEDLFLSQNFFDVRPEDPQAMSGRGLWLRGDGKGGFDAVPGQESGIAIYGQQRGAALADFDRDGRVDLAVAQNNAPLKLYRNTAARPGLRVRLRGNPGNADAIGAVMRLDFGGKQGPVREIQAGAGAWSQNAAVQVLGMPEPAQALWVRWPDGKETKVDLPSEAREVIVTPSGTIQSALIR